MTYNLNFKTIFSLFLVGIIGGCVGIGLTLLMHIIQHLTFNAPLDAIMPFRVMVEDASPLRRVLALLVCGLIGGVGWFCIHRYGQPLVDIKTAVQNKDKNLPFLTTFFHSLLQIITVAMGSPLGREVAPREMTATFATQWIGICHFSDEERKILLACASGAGLAAVYNVPLAAMVFTLETLLLSWSITSVISAFICCSTAVFIVRIGLGDLVQYPIEYLRFNEYLVFWAVIAGPIIGITVFLFDKSIKWLPKLPKSNPIMILISIGAFGLIGILSIKFPEILGNGKAANQLTFTSDISLNYAIGLFSTKWTAILLAMVAGAYGGRITPSMMLGGALGFITACLWNIALPNIPMSSSAIIAAAVFLGIAQKMPLTSALFMIELSRFSPAYFYPICLCFATALPTYYFIQNKLTNIA
ncbi:chloride channel protein [Commensalibacter papalotli (ex Botero et al. 2024)]|uniref:H+/Cl- antiporter ClcA (ClcA) (PDB:1KPK) n=1 Tax=Commensalibacter papalotli (ex Botero et al. 2024) TaxID=2972766 RepID=A0ABN8W414_9PROT|nr:chloride channel protein [Commensalibacter papalotli (ex Botero et al. 2024)]CAI3922993.1 H+/Cl- antiporter ClcA (ClcA) (PDB:1KPK) [Commensalibacter papalotli (ex Botero et al. 2024)]CAI3929159.1 H+/Cl- antiporter ClcA (ClcA) (PDB:1KPK) [Commensalibacter papalotli (ex Botero et al. 2024)]